MIKKVNKNRKYIIVTTELSSKFFVVETLKVVKLIGNLESSIKISNVSYEKKNLDEFSISN